MTQSINIYEYIAANDTYAAKVVCNKYGYSLQGAETPAQIGYCLEQLVAAEGEAAFRDIVALHPDKGLLVDLYGTPVQQSASEGCGCKKKSESKTIEAMVHSAQQNTGHTLHQGNTFLFAGVLILAVALIACKN